MNEETLNRLMQKALTAAFDDRKVATKDDLDDIKGALQRHEDKFSSLEARLAALERAPATMRPPRTSVGGISVDSDTSASSGGNEWIPKLIQLREWVAWGCGPDDKLREEKTQEVARRVPVVCELALALCFQPLQPFALNHSLSFKVCDGSSVRRRADELDSTRERKQLKVRGHAVRAGPEISPERRRQYASFFSILRRLEAACPGNGVWEPCARGMAFYPLPQWSLLGRVARACPSSGASASASTKTTTP